MRLAPPYGLSAEIQIQEINSSALALDPVSRWMFAAVPGREGGLSICWMLVAVSALIADLVEFNDYSGGVVELLHRTQLVCKRGLKALLTPTG
jgi:hypothetical protein